MDSSAGPRGHPLNRFLPQAGKAPLAQLIPQLLNVLTTLNQGLVLVLGDYHTITNTAIHNSVTQLLTYLPPGIHLVLTTRCDPPCP